MPSSCNTMRGAVDTSATFLLAFGCALEQPSKLPPGELGAVKEQASALEIVAGVQHSLDLAAVLDPIRLASFSVST
jgi:hypothetical protein